MSLHGVIVGALSAGLCVLCMCSSSMPRPPSLGDCDAGCDPVTGGGSSSPPAGSNDAGAGTTSDAAVCGIADTHVQGSDTLCAPCIIQNCCSQDTSCTDTCTSLLDCTQGCASGDTICLGSCENQWTAGLTAYQAFIQCVQESCTTTCPALMQ